MSKERNIRERTNQSMPSDFIVIEAGNSHKTPMCGGLYISSDATVDNFETIHDRTADFDKLPKDRIIALQVTKISVTAGYVILFTG